MAYISSFTYCDNIQKEITPQGPRPQVVNPLQVLAPVAIPGNYSFSISYNLAGFDPTKENKVRLEFISPSNKIIYDTNDINFQIPKEKLNLDKPAVMQFNLDIRNLVFREKGLYTTKIQVNSEEVGEYKIEVIVGDQNGANS